MTAEAVAPELADPHASPASSPFQSFWWGGFECSSHRHRDGRRIDVVGASQHDRWAADDYRALAAHGLRTVRDGIRWPLVETRAGRYDWTSFLPQLRAARETGTQVVWDLCHYGVPDDLDIWQPAFVDRFAAFARAAARLVRDESRQAGAATDAVPWWCPVNEISFWAWAGGDAAFFPPFATGRGFELKVQLARAALAAADAVRSVDPRARLLWAEPAVHVVPDPQRPHEAGAAEGYRLAQYQALDLLSGRLWPQIGGAPGVLDTVGVNYYPQNQWIHGGPPIGPGHPGYRPFSEMLVEIHERYGRPVVVSETGTEGDDRAPWLRDVVREVQAARAAGADVQGVCWYPIANHPGWDDDRHCPNGLLGYADDAGQRPVHAPLARELTRWVRTAPNGPAPRRAPTPSGPDAVRRRAVAGLFPPPDPRLVASVVVPARDEAERLPALAAALAAQRDAGGRPFAPGTVDVLVLLNNTTDASAEALAGAAEAHPGLTLHVASVGLGGTEAHVGRARQMALDAVWSRFDALGTGGLLLTTDADTAPAPDWLAETQAAVAAGADAVGGRVLLRPDERRALPPGVRRLYLLDLAYRRALEELHSLYAPCTHDPFPRHHQHFGASLAVTAEAYGAVGGVPAAAALEDVALAHALDGAGFRLRHSDRVRVFTSARASGRAGVGLSTTLAAWERLAAEGREPLVEPAAHAERRLQALGRAGAGSALAPTPDAAPGAEAPLSVALADLRRRVARLCPLPLAVRLTLPVLP